jgi:hypothetical protein
MPSNPHSIQDKDGNLFDVYVLPDRRLKKMARWTRKEDNKIVVRIPYRMPRQNIDTLLESISTQLNNPPKPKVRPSDEGLQARAQQINHRYFNDELSWNSIRWANNMRNRLGSCTNGGPTDGHVRINDRVSDWPQWVIDYVIAHELAHRKFPNHSPEFWAYLRSGYPQTERALGFIQGFSLASREAINTGDESLE